MTLASLTRDEPGLHLYGEFAGARYYIRSYYGPIPVEAFAAESKRLAQAYPEADFSVTNNRSPLQIDGSGSRSGGAIPVSSKQEAEDSQTEDKKAVYYPLQRALGNISSCIPAIGVAMGDGKKTATVDIQIAEELLHKALDDLRTAKDGADRRAK
tara:strand:- start:1740 stop:2204 length:465 start_codon:yes stop_codon:yes gene_type:complete